MDGTQRAIVEETVVACVLCSEDCLRIALAELPLKPFRSGIAENLHVIFYWAVGQLAIGTYDGVKNPARLAEEMALKDWPGKWDEFEAFAWADSFWSPIMYHPAGFRELCRGLAAENVAVESHQKAVRANESNRHIMYALNQSLPTVPPSEGPSTIKAWSR